MEKFAKIVHVVIAKIKNQQPNKGEGQSKESNKNKQSLLKIFFNTRVVDALKVIVKKVIVSALLRV
jgi:hypothetical protein